VFRREISERNHLKITVSMLSEKPTDEDLEKTSESLLKFYRNTLSKLLGIDLTRYIKITDDSKKKVFDELKNIATESEELEQTEEPDPEFNTYEWVTIISYYAMFHSVNALLRKIGVKVGKQYTHEITTNLLLYYFYYTKIIEEELLKIYENAEEKAKELVVSYIFAKEERTKYQYEVNLESEKKNAEKILNDAVNFVSRLKDIDKTLSKELVLTRLDKKAL